MQIIDIKTSETLLELAINAAIKAGSEIMNVYQKDDFGIESKADNSPLTIADKKSHDIISSELAKTGLPVLSEEGKEITFSERKEWKYFWIVDPLDGTKEFIKRNGEFTVNIALIEKDIPIAGLIYAPVLKKLYFAAKHLSAYRFDIKNTDIDYSFANIKANSVLLNKKDCDKNKVRVVASRSHMCGNTNLFIENLRKKHKEVQVVSAGSALKFCLLAEGEADIYPRFSPTMEWDTAAGQIICECTGFAVLNHDESDLLKYNKEVLTNQGFIVRKN